MSERRKRLVIIDERDELISFCVEQFRNSRYVQVIAEVREHSLIFTTIQQHKPDLILLGSISEMNTVLLAQQIRFYFPMSTCMVVFPLEEAHLESFLRHIGVFILQKTILVQAIEAFALTGESPNPAMPYPPFAHPETNSFSDQSAKRMDTHQQHLLTIYGPKGGVGKTFLSRELAIYYAGLQREGRALKVLAVDFNLDLGTFATTLNLPRTPNIFTWVQHIDQQLNTMIQRDRKDSAYLSHEEWQDYAGRYFYNSQELEQFIVTHPESGLHVLTSPCDIRNSFEIKDYHLYVILETIKRSDYDVVLIDTAPDTTDATIQALFFAEKVVMVGSPVVDAIENIHRVLKLLREAEYPEDKIQICINRLQKREMFTLEEMKAYFQIHPSKTLLTIPDDEEVKRSINTGVSLRSSPSRSQAKTAIEKIANVLLPITKEPVKGATLSRSEKGKGFFQWFQKGLGK
ncbi:AAA family ATPase [Brevibacillus daliensis]|uniref:AAA family ATPase n=1 Tax=Brevibacillus daliensis TaxID=2892995 RepID=UPI001E295382|nr:AAA family ATPase [Brevibacillus daliensis]